jgi:hypothetical protein
MRMEVWDHRVRVAHKKMSEMYFQEYFEANQGLEYFPRERIECQSGRLLHGNVNYENRQRI